MGILPQLNLNTKTNMADTKSRSKSRSRSRSRSRSPRRQPAKEEKTDFSKAFKFKSKDKKQQDSGRNERDYRQRDDSYRPKRYGGDDDRSRRNDRERDRDRRDGDSNVTDKFGSSVKDKFGGNSVKDKFGSSAKDKFGGASEKKKEGAKPPAAPVAATTTFILVTVNDRLGTKATIPALPQDTVGDFKKMVAAHIGRQPHEIMLKRQGERPFKDFITLGDYGVSSGVQLDLELDTGE